MNGLRLLLSLVCLVAVSGPVSASEEPPRDTIRFQVERERDVNNDRVVAVLIVQAEDPDPAALASRLNQTMEWALQQVGGKPALQISTGNYQTHPLRDKQVHKGWRGSQELHLRSTELSQVSAVLGTLQEKLQIRSMGFEVSPEQRRAVEDELIEEALTAFQARADLISKRLGASGYELGELQIHGGGQRPPVPVMRAQVASFEVSPVAMEGGTSRVTVTISGNIELARQR